MNTHPLQVERELRGWSRSKVAEMLGTTTRSIIRWEQGKVVPYPYYRERLCAIFGKTAQQLGLLAESPLQDPYQDRGSMQLTLELPSETLLSFSPSRSPQQDLLLDPTLPRIRGRAESLVGRDRLLAQIKQDLLQADSPPSLALQGLPGIGKTALARALACDPQIQAHFHDGILWAQLGPQPNVLGHLARWASLLEIPTSQMQHLHSPEDWHSILQAALDQRHLLFIIDDAWTIQDALALRINTPGCTCLLTSRLPQVAFAFAQERVTRMAELSEVDGLALLTHFVPQLTKTIPRGPKLWYAQQAAYHWA